MNKTNQEVAIETCCLGNKAKFLTDQLCKRKALKELRLVKQVGLLLFFLTNLVEIFNYKNCFQEAQFIGRGRRGGGEQD